MTIGFVGPSHRRSLALLIGLVLALASSTRARSAPVDEARIKAEACSEAVIAQNAIPARNAPAALALRAYDSCIDAWADAAHLLSDRIAINPAVAALQQNDRTLNGSTPAGAYLGLRSAALTLRADFLHAAVLEIRAIRAGSASDDAADP